MLQERLRKLRKFNITADVGEAAALQNVKLGNSDPQ